MGFFKQLQTAINAVSINTAKPKAISLQDSLQLSEVPFDVEFRCVSRYTGLQVGFTERLVPAQRAGLCLSIVMRCFAAPRPQFRYTSSSFGVHMKKNEN